MTSSSARRISAAHARVVVADRGADLAGGEVEHAAPGRGLDEGAARPHDGLGPELAAVADQSTRVHERDPSSKDGVRADAFDDARRLVDRAPATRRTPSVGMPAAMPGGDPGRRVLDHDAALGSTPSRSRREQEHVRRGLAVLDLVARDRDLERQARAGQRAVQPLAHATEEATAIGTPALRRSATACSASSNGTQLARRSARTARASIPATAPPRPGIGARSARYAWVRAYGMPTWPPGPRR